MICPRCGVINTTDAERCTRCRGSLARVPVPGAESPAGGAPDAAEPGTPAGTVAEGTQPPGAGSQPLPPQPLPPPPAVPAPAWSPPPTSWPAPPAPPAPHAPDRPGRPPVWGAPQPSWPGRANDRAWKPAGTVPTYLPWAVLCTILLFPLGGIVAIVYGVLVNRRLAVGDWDGASRASRLARRWCLISVGIGALVLLLLATGVVKNPYTRP